MRASFGAIAVLVLAGTLSADDWTAFRGSAGNGISAEKKAPVSWGPDKNVKWKVALPRPCNGSPIVSNGRVFTTSAEDPEGRRRSLYCFDRKDGRKLWVRTVDFGRKMPTHRDNKYCGTTPVADGKRVVVWHSSAGLYCYDFEGKELWKRNLGEFRHMWGYGTSPILHEGKVILHTGPGATPFIAAFNLEDGKTIWKQEEPNDGVGPTPEGYFNSKAGNKKLLGSWCTPVIANVKGKDQVICVMPTRVVAYAPEDGEILWWCGGLPHKEGDLQYSSPVIAADVCMVIAGYRGPGIGVRMDGKGDVRGTHQLWRVPVGPSSIGSGVFVDGYIYAPNTGGPIHCIDPKTGEELWDARPDGVKGRQWGSVVHAAGRLYLMNQAGETVVFKPTPKDFELIGVNRMGEPTNSTLAFSDGEIFLQTHRNLYCIAE